MFRVRVARAELFQTRAVIRWNNGEEYGRPYSCRVLWCRVLVDDHRTSSPIMSVPAAALTSPDDFVSVAHWSM
jgi:hypothetical protein